MIQGWNSTNPIFRTLIEKHQPKVIVEVGSWLGASAVNMAQICKQLGLDTKIYCIDTWLGAIEFYTQPTEERNLQLKDGYPQVYYQFMQNVCEAGVEDMIVPITLPSNLGLKLLEQRGIKADLVYIDGSHEYEDVKNDIELSRKLSSNLFGDDYTNAVFPGVKKAVLDSIKEGENVEIIDNWFWII